MKFDLNQTGLRRIFRAWQVEIMEYLWETQETVKSVDVYLYLEQKGIHSTRGTRNTISRASVINFLNDLVAEGIVTYTEDTGLGGYHRIYSLAERSKTREGFKNYVKSEISIALQAFIEDE